MKKFRRILLRFLLSMPIIAIQIVWYLFIYRWYKEQSFILSVFVTVLEVLLILHILNARGTSLTITGGDFEEPMVITEFPATITLSVPGTYTLKQTTYYGTETEESVYVKMPEAESNITEIRSNLYNPDREKNEADYYKDVLTYIAAALVALLFLEWCLHLKDGV